MRSIPVKLKSLFQESTYMDWLWHWCVLNLKQDTCSGLGSPTACSLPGLLRSHLLHRVCTEKMLIICSKKLLLHSFLLSSQAEKISRLSPKHPEDLLKISLYPFTQSPSNQLTGRYVLAGSQLSVWKLPVHLYSVPCVHFAEVLRNVYTSCSLA